MIADERLARVQVIDHGEPLFIELVHRHGREEQATDPEMKGGAIGVGYQRVRCLLHAVVQEAIVSVREAGCRVIVIAAGKEQALLYRGSQCLGGGRRRQLAQERQRFQIETIADAGREGEQ